MQDGMANIILHVLSGYPRKKTQNPGEDAILPVISTQSTARVLVDRYVTSTSRGAHAIDLFDEHSRCLVSHTHVHVHTSTCTKWAILKF